MSDPKRSIAAVYKRYHQSLYRFCFAIVGNAEDAQDALQNAMLKAIRALPGEQREIQLKPWLYRIAHNESIEILRKRREEARVDPELIASAAGPEETVATRERLRRLLSDIAELPERQRGALVMRELAGLGFGELGEALGTSEAVARQTVYEARLGLRQLEAGREMSCEGVMRQISDADGRTMRRRDIRAHLRACPGCRRFREEIEGRSRDLAAIAPLPAAASAGVLHALLGAGGAGQAGLSTGTGAGAASTIGAGAGKAVATSAVLKSAAAVAVVAAIGVGTADRSGVIHIASPGRDDSAAVESSATTVEAGGGGAAAAAHGSTGLGEHAAAQSADGGTIVKAAATTTPDEGAAESTGTDPSAEGEGGSAAGTPPASGHGQDTAAANKAKPHGNSGKKQGQATHGQSASPHSHGHGKPKHTTHKGGNGGGTPQAGQERKPHPAPTSPAEATAEQPEARGAPGGKGKGSEGSP